MKSRPRFNKSEERPQYKRVNREDNNNGAEFGRYKQYKRFNNNENTPNRFNNNERNGRGGDFEPRYGNEVHSVGRGGYNKGGYRGGYNAENGNGEKPFANKYQSGQRPQYGNKGNRKGAYDPSAKYSAKKRAAYKEATLDPNAPVRLNKYLANAGICSRREADN